MDEKIATFIKSLDEESKAIVFYCWRNDYATIRELSNFISAKNDSYTLFKIKEVINADALKTFGKPALVFREKAFDAATKEIVNFAWWFALEIPKKELFRIRVEA